MLRPRRNLFQFLIFDQDILAVVVFVAANHFGAFHATFASGAKERLAQGCFAFLMDLMEIHALAARGGKQVDRNGQQTEAERTFPHGMSHQCLLPQQAAPDSPCYPVNSRAQIR
jgi:hypothetical protein